MLKPEFPSISNLTRPARWILAFIIGGLSFGALFGFLSGNALIRIRQAGIAPEVRDPQAIRGWMTIPYIARVYNIPPDILYQAIHVSPAANNRKSLDELNRIYHPGQRGAMLHTVEQGISNFNIKQRPSPQVIL